MTRYNNIIPGVIITSGPILLLNGQTNHIANLNIVPE